MRCRTQWYAAMFTAALLMGCSAEGPMTGIELKGSADHSSIPQCVVYNPVEDEPDTSPAQWESTAASWWAALDENVPDDDTSYLYRNRYGPNPETVTGTVRLDETLGAPPAGATGTIRVRWKVIGNYSLEYPPTMLNVTLLHGSTPISSFGVWPSGNYVTATRSVNLSNLGTFKGFRLRLNADLKPVDFDMIQARVTWANLEVCS